MDELEISPAALRQKLSAGEKVCLIDVRQPWEHETAALSGCILVPLDRFAQEMRAFEVPPPDVLVVTYCHHGMRSANAAAYLRRIGFPHVRSLAGGIDAWAAEVDPDTPRY